MDRLKALLNEKGISQREFAEMIGITEVSLGRYINDRRVPKGTVVVKMAQALNTSVEDLMSAVCSLYEPITLSNVMDWLRINANATDIPLNENLEYFRALKVVEKVINLLHEENERAINNDSE